jgi:hypothetical protein
MSAEKKLGRQAKPFLPSPRLMVPVGDLRTVTLRALGPDHPLYKILVRQPNEIPAAEFNARVSDWLILLEA